MRFSTVGRKIVQSSSSTPWKMAERFVAAPALMLTELRTMTDVIGMPPTRPATTLPTPWANSSRLGGE